MSDLISRQAVENITWEEPSYSDPLNVLTEVREKVRALPSVEPCREADDYENEIADLHNRLDIAEYDKERYKEEITILEAKNKVDVPDTATNEDVMNETLRRVFPKTIFIRSQSIANKTQAINMSDEWLGRNYKEMYK